MKPWENEPDYEEFMWEGNFCKIVRNQTMGFLCGYVGVTKEHPLYGSYKAESVLECHGGITFSDSMGEEDDLWYFGFDCGHAFDLMPYMEEIYESITQLNDSPYRERTTYRDIDYVRQQVQQLSTQLTKNKLQYLFVDRN